MKYYYSKDDHKITEELGAICKLLYQLGLQFIMNSDGTLSGHVNDIEDLINVCASYCTAMKIYRWNIHTDHEKLTFRFVPIYTLEDVREKGVNS